MNRDDIKKVLIDEEEIKECIRMLTTPPAGAYLMHESFHNNDDTDFTRPWLENSPYAEKIKFYIGDALELLPSLDLTFDLAFVDGDKRKYIEYYELAGDKSVLWENFM